MLTSVFWRSEDWRRLHCEETWKPMHREDWLCRIATVSGPITALFGAPRSGKKERRSGEVGATTLPRYGRILLYTIGPPDYGRCLRFMIFFQPRFARHNAGLLVTCKNAGCVANRCAAYDPQTSLLRTPHYVMEDTFSLAGNV